MNSHNSAFAIKYYYFHRVLAAILAFTFFFLKMEPLETTLSTPVIKSQSFVLHADDANVKPFFILRGNHSDSYIVAHGRALPALLVWLAGCHLRVSLKVCECLSRSVSGNRNKLKQLHGFCNSTLMESLKPDVGLYFHKLL